MRDYEKICDFQNLYQAHIVARRSKRYKREVIKFEMDLAGNLARMKEELETKAYQMKGYYSFYLYEPKKRLVDAAHYPDRVVQHSICDNVLGPIIQKRLIHDNAACQVNKGTHFALKRLSKFLRQHYLKHGAQGYFLKCDVAKYFPSIDQQVLKQKLKRIIKDTDVRNLVFHFIDSYQTKEQPGKGLPLGNQSSQWFAIYYLDSLDRLIKEKLRIKHYIRYMDDLILVHHSKEYLKEVLKEMTTFLEDELKLKFNDKTRIFPIRNGAEFLGFRFYLTQTGKVIRRLRTDSKIRYKRRMKALQRDYANRKIDFRDVQNSLASYSSHLKHGHTYRLKERMSARLLFRRNEE